MINLKNIITGMFVSLLGFSSIEAQALMDREFIDVITNKDKTYLVASIFREKTPVKRPLLKFENGLKGGDSSKQVAVLKEYYEIMISGEAKKAAKLFFKGDGSRERFIEGLISIPNRYKGFKDLERIDFLDSFGWGPFRLYEVQLTASGNISIKWREAVICNENNCYLTNQIDQADSGIRELSQIRSLLDASASNQQKLSEIFTNFNNKAQFLPTGSNTYSTFQNIQYPLTFSFDMERISPFNLDLKDAIKNNNIPSMGGADLGVLVNLINDIGALAHTVENRDLKNLTDSDPEKSSVIDAFNSVLDQYRAPNTTQDIYLYSLFKNKKKQQGIFKREWYHPVAAIQRISKWKTITILGFIPQDENKIAVFFQPTSHDQNGEVKIEPIQGIAITKTKKGSKLMLTDFTNNAVQTINFALEATVLEMLGNKYAESPTFIYDL